MLGLPALLEQRELPLLHETGELGEGSSFPLPCEMPRTVGSLLQGPHHFSVPLQRILLSRASWKLTFS